jgi:RND family efflux transporter MFP subunit
MMLAKMLHGSDYPGILLLAFLLSSIAQAEDLGDLDCVIEPHMVVDLSSRVDGIVESLEVQRGELIEKDQVLVLLESEVERAAVAETQARAEAMAEILSSNVSLEFSQRRKDRLEELHRSQALSSDQMDEMATETELTELQLRQARENKNIAALELRRARQILKRHTIRSPIRGIVVQRYLSPGESVEEEPIMRLAQIDPLRVEVIVPVSAFGSIKTGQSALIYPESPMDGQYAAKVTIVDGVADAASGTFRVRLGLPNKDYSLPSGLKCRVSFLPYEELPNTQLAESTPAPELPDAFPEETALDDAKVTAVAKIESTPESRAGPVPGRVLTAAAAPESSGAMQCQTIGPLKNAPEADRVMAAIADQATQIGVREVNQASADEYLILSPPQSSTQEAQLLTDQMKTAGFEDFYIFNRGPHKGRVSLGLYRDKVIAEEKRSWLAKIGFESELVPRRKAHPRFWLDVELRPRITALDLGEATESLGRADLATTPCNIVTAGQ